MVTEPGPVRGAHAGAVKPPAHTATTATKKKAADAAGTSNDENDENDDDDSAKEEESAENDDDFDRALESRFWGRFYIAPDAPVVVYQDLPEDNAVLASAVHVYQLRAAERARLWRRVHQGPASEGQQQQQQQQQESSSSSSSSSYRSRLRPRRLLLSSARAEDAARRSDDRWRLVAAQHWIRNYTRTVIQSAYSEMVRKCGWDEDEDNDNADEPMTELAYFTKHCDCETMVRLVQEIVRIATFGTHRHNGTDDNVVPYTVLLAKMDTSTKNKTQLLRHLEAMQKLDPASAEGGKMKHLLDNAMRLPFGRLQSVDLSLPADQVLRRAWDAMEKSTYGLVPAKVQIMQTLSRWIQSSAGGGGALAFHGPPGTGKTSLVRRGLCAALGRAFAFVPLGGVSAAEHLTGFAWTYQSSTWGCVADALLDCQCMNPVLYFDELDKLSGGGGGGGRGGGGGAKEAEQVLMQITDPSQNTKFADRFFHGLELDVSQCLTVFAYNDETLVNPILRDRLTVIHLPGYTDAEKIEIARLHLVPECLAVFAFAAGDVVFGPEILRQMIGMVEREEGVRNLKRAIEAVVGKINLRKLLDRESAAVLRARDVHACLEDDVVLPFVVRQEHLRTFLATGADARNGAMWRNMFV